MPKEARVTPRTAKESRETGETKVSVELNLDGQGIYQVDTGNGMFDHLLAQIARHSLIDLTVSAKGDTDVGWHHLVEDTAIVLGRSLRQAVGDGRGIMRMAHSAVPLDEALALVAVDFGGRGYAVLDLGLTDTDLGGLAASLIDHFLETLAREGAFNLHVRVLAGINNHHKAEAVFKALARAMRAALEPDERRSGDAPSTKGVIG
jgi:imidazoleglycerol-phosphate dehydratase